MSAEERVNEFLTTCFYSILNAEEKAIAAITNGELSLSEIHVIEAVIKAQAVFENNYSNIAKILGITLGALTKSYNKLESKGYLKKEQAEDDKRIYYIVPTQAAEAVNREHAAFHKKMVSSIAKKLPKRDLNNLADALDALYKFFNDVM